MVRKQYLTNKSFSILPYKLLAETIPDRSFAVGANEVEAFAPPGQPNRNHDMQNMQNGWPAERTSDDPDEPWLHNDLKSVAYLYVWPLFDKIVEEGDLK